MLVAQFGNDSMFRLEIDLLQEGVKIFRRFMMNWKVYGMVYL